MHLAEPVSAFRPITAALKRTCKFRPHIEWGLRRLPSHVETEGVLAILLQRALPGTANFEPRTGKEEAHAPAHMALRIHALDADTGHRGVDRIVHVRFGT